MGKKSPKAPSAASQAAAQTQSNKETAFWNAKLNNVNQITPYGNMTWSGGGTVDNPQAFTSTINLSPEQQQILDSQNRQDIAMGGLAERQIGRIQDATANPYSYSGIKNALPTYDSIQSATSAAQDALMSRLNPQYAQQEEALRTRLINQGIGQGSQAYQREMDTFNQARNDALQQAILNAQAYGANEQNMAMQRRLQEIGEYDSQRNAPLNEYIGMSSGTQVSNPQFSNTSYAGTQPFDISGAMRNQYSNQAAAANNRSSAMSSLFGLGGSLIGGPVGGFLGSAVGGLFSDIRLKENIMEAGEKNGHKLYTFSYKGQPERWKGVMAQDILETNPEAVSEIGGFYAVDYDSLGLTMEAVNG